MKALSIRQPWAWCVVTGRKPVENRAWRTSFRGRIFVHAGKRFDAAGFDWLKEQGLIPAEMQPGDFPRGGIVGKVDIVDCVDAMDSPWFFGPRGLVLERGEELPLCEMNGRLGFFSPNLTFPDFLAMVEAAKSPGQIKTAIECLDRCWREVTYRDPDAKHFMRPDDWLTIEQTARETIKRLNKI